MPTQIRMRRKIPAVQSVILVLDLFWASNIKVQGLRVHSAISLRRNTYLENLKDHILPQSQSQDWETAKSEWEFDTVEFHDRDEGPTNCPCSHEIYEMCWIENTMTHQRTYVGNVCVNRFMDIDTVPLVSGLKRIKKDVSARISKNVIEYAWRKGYLWGNEEKSFLLSIAQKQNRRLTEKQLAWKQKIRRRIIKQIYVSKPRKPQGSDLSESSDSDKNNYCGEADEAHGGHSTVPSLPWKNRFNRKIKDPVVYALGRFPADPSREGIYSSWDDIFAVIKGHDALMH